MPTSATTTSFAITAKKLTVTDGDLVVKKAFDNSTSAGTVTSGKLGLKDVEGTDDVSVKIDTVGVYADANVGKNKTVTLNISLEGAKKGNYTLDSANTYKFTKAEITKVAYVGTEATATDASKAIKTDTTVTLEAQTAPSNETIEYGYSDSITGTIVWKDSNAFTGLSANTDYYFYARVKETDTHAAGVTSVGTKIKTDKVAYTGTQSTAPSKIADKKTDISITLKTVTPPTGEAVEYGIDTNNDGTITWQTDATFSTLSADTEYKFYTRVKENDKHKAGTASASATIKTKKAPTTVSGNVKDSDGSNLAGAKVTLTPSDPLITATTDANGKYTINNVPEGTYSLVIKNGDITITDKIDVAGKPITGKDMQFLDGDKNTVVEATPNAPEVAVGGMNDLLNNSNINSTLTPEEKKAVDANGSVELKFTADLKTTTEGTQDKSELEAIAGNQKIDLLLDLSVLKTVKDSSGNTLTNGEKISTLADIIEIRISIPADLQSKAGLSLYRMHNGKPEKLSTTPDANGEFYSIDQSGEFMTVHVKNFSTYALGYNAYTVTVLDGGTGASGKGNYSSGDTVTINAGTKTDYSFNGWTVTTGTVSLVNAGNASTTFTMPAENVTVTASWTFTGSNNPGGGGNQGGGSTGGGSSSDTYFYIKATAGQGGSMSTSERVKVRAGESAGFTIIPDKGYQIADVQVNGKSIGAKNSYVFTNVLSDQTIHATFKKAGHSNPQTGVSTDER
ncbi:MAG: carboxypeptidase regulatory-like domain-containing protein [Oscillospiraceae bacterium]